MSGPTSFQSVGGRARGPMQPAGPSFFLLRPGYPRSKLVEVATQAACQEGTRRLVLPGAYLGSQGSSEGEGWLPILQMRKRGGMSQGSTTDTDRGREGAR